MSVVEGLYQICIYPLELLFEFVFSLEMRLIPSYGVCILLLSLFINIILLPVYAMLDRIEGQQRQQEDRLSCWSSHIRKTFRGDERYFMLKTYYRQNAYRPYYSLKCAFPLLLEIPFFIAAYHFLKHLTRLSGVSFLNIQDLLLPDNLIQMGIVKINVLPLVMTVFNLVSIKAYAGKRTLKEKGYLYGMAVFFLVLLYSSPSGLVLYWTCNNFFALLKNILISGRNKKGGSHSKTANTGRIDSYDIGFISSQLIMILLLGALIPTTVLKSSPMEFVDYQNLQNPLHFIWGSLFIAVGFFGLWLSFLYYIARSFRGKINLLMRIFSCTALVGYFFYAMDLGFISPFLKYTGDLSFSETEITINMITVFFVIVISVVLFRFKKDLLDLLQAAAVFVLLCMIILNCITVTRIYQSSDYEISRNSEITVPLSRTSPNVIVLMLDRAISGYVPYIFQEKPELQEKFSGFTYYPNTLSFGLNTAMGSPAIYGGYEYTHVMDEESRNQALKLMPALFSDAGYDVSVFDPPYANGRIDSDLSIYDDLPVKALRAKQSFRYIYDDQSYTDRRFRNFFCYGFCKVMPLVFQTLLYDEGYYNDVAVYKNRPYYKADKVDKMSEGIGYNYMFEQQFAELCNLPSITQVTEDKEGSFLIFTNDTTHEPTILSEPAYLPADYVDNTEYDAEHKERFVLDGRVLHVDNWEQMYHYQVNMAAFLKLGEWFDELKRKGVYDNTRIILVADHGYALGQFDDLLHDDGFDAQSLNPLLMVKDFDAKDYRVDDTLMTNADVPTLAMNGLVKDPVNPYTGKEITSEAKKDDTIVIQMPSGLGGAEEESFTPLYSNVSYMVKGNIFDSDNWSTISTK